MRHVIFAAIMLASAAPAGAGSIDSIASSNASSSIETIRCEGCGAIRKKVAEKAPVPELAPGTQKIELREVNGEMKVFRTEAWLGGSPVVFVSKAPPKVQADIADAASKEAVGDNPEAVPVVIDEAATTSAVSADMAPKELAAQPQEPKPFDPSTLQLRLN